MIWPLRSVLLVKLLFLPARRKPRTLHKEREGCATRKFKSASKAGPPAGHPKFKGWPTRKFKIVPKAGPPAKSTRSKGADAVIGSKIQRQRPGHPPNRSQPFSSCPITRETIKASHPSKIARDGPPGNSSPASKAGPPAGTLFFLQDLNGGYFHSFKGREGCATRKFKSVSKAGPPAAFSRARV
jgi:hypothetical protein